jgi:hypothetical protein
MGNTLAMLEVSAPSDIETIEHVRATRARVQSRIWMLVRKIAGSLSSTVEWLFGLASLVVILSTLAAWPLVQLLTLGYLLESSARVARSGRLRDGFIGVRRAAHFGGMALGIWLALVPAWLLQFQARAAGLIDPASAIARNWRTAFVVVMLLTSFHVAIACMRGGRLRQFLWPLGHPFWLMRRLREGNLYVRTRDKVWDYVAELRLPHYLRLGFVGFIGTLAWLAVPAILIALGGRQPLLGIAGALLLALCAPSLPFLQVHYVVEGRFASLFARRSIRQRFLRAPWAFAFALIVLLVAAAIPLYLLKIEMVPRDVAWLPSVVFVVFLAPARLLTGWAYARSSRHEQPRHWLLRWMGRLAIIPAALLYVLVVFLAQYTSWGGVTSLYEQHAFLLPVPFLNM